MFGGVLKILNSDKKLFCYAIMNKENIPLTMEIKKHQKENHLVRYFLGAEELLLGTHNTNNSDRSSIPRPIRELKSYDIAKFTFNDYSVYLSAQNKFEKALKMSNDRENMMIKTVCKKWTKENLLKEVYSFCEESDPKEYLFYTVAGW